MMRDDPKTEAELLRYLSALRSRAAQPEQAELEKQTAGANESEQIFRAIFDNAADGIVLADVDNKKFYMANKVFREMLGRNEDHFKDLGIADIHPAEDLPYVTEQFEKQARKELTLAKDIPVKRLDGSVFFADVNSFPITLGQKTYLMGIFRDVTERRLAIEEIRRLAGFPEENPNPVLRISADCTLLYANRASSPVLETWRIQVGQRLPEACCKRAKEALSSGKVSKFEFNCDDGRIFLITLAPGVEHAYVNAYALDITERKNAERQLRESSDLLERTFCSLNDAVFILDNDIPPRIIDCNPAAVSIFGYEKNHLLERTTDFLHVSRESQLEFQKKLLRAVDAHGRPSSFEFKMKRENGQIFPTEHSMSPLKNDEGDRVGWVSVVRDITERKQAEQALRESEEQFRITFERAAEGILLLRAEDGEIIDFNQAACEQLGYTRAEFQKLTIADVEVIESAEDVVEHMAKVSRNRGDTFETKHRAKDGSIREKLVSCGVAAIAGQGRVVSIWNDVTEIRRAEEALRQSEQKWRSLAENAPDTIITADLDGTILFLNRPVPPLTQEQVIGTSLYDYIPAEHRSTMRNAIEQLVRTGEPCGYELAGTGPGGRVSWYRSRIGPIKRDDRVVALTLIARDVTEHKQIEQALRESELRYRTLFETLPVGVGLATTDGRILDANSAMLQMMGRSAQEIGQINLPDTYNDPQKRELFLERLQRDGFVRDFELLLKRKDGATYYASVNATPVKLGDETVIVTAAKDITAHKKAQEELAQSEQTLRSLVNSITESVLLLDTKGTILAINSSAAKRMGHSADELIGKCAYEFLPAEIAEHRKHQVAEVVRTGRLVQFEDRPPGRILHHSLSPIFDSSGKVERLAIFASDLTERGRMQEALAESEEKYKTLVESAGDPIATIDRNGVLLFVNRAGATYLAGQPEELAGKTLWDVFPKESADEHVAGVREVIDTAKGSNVIKMIRVPGSPRWFNTTLQPLRDSSGKVTAAMLIARDIDDMKQAEEQIHRLSSAVEQSIDGISIGDLEHRLRYVNAAYARMHGYTAEEMIGMKIQDLQDKTQAVGYESVIRQIEAQGAWTGEREHVKKDGTSFPCYVSITLLKNDTGQATGRLAVCKDMTEYKRTQQMMIIKDAAIASSISGIAICDPAGNLTYANDSFLEMWGYENQQEVLGRNAAEFSQLPNHTQQVLDIMRGGQGWIGESTGIKKDGSPFDIQLCATTVADENGRPIAMMSSFVDITERKKSQQMMMIKDAAMASSINAIVIGDVEGNLTYVNDSFLRMWGYEEQNEVLGRNAAEFWEVNDETETIVEALKRDEGWIGELTARRKDGSPFDAQVCQTTIRDEGGTILWLMASFVDITESKRSSEELTLYREKMAHAEQLASLGSLSATVAHELTQPLTVIRLSLESALEKTERRSAPETIAKKLRNSLNQVSNIVSLTERFRNFARKSSERSFRDVDLKAIAERITRLLDESSRRAGITVRLDKNMGQLPSLHCHEKDMEQLFFALIDNAIRAAEGKKKRELVISGVVKDGHVELRFADDCGGIAPENLDRVFEPFFTTRPAGQGTGLGLCIVQEIVSRARGRVDVESKFGEGSTFFVTLPLSENTAY